MQLPGVSNVGAVGDGKVVMLGKIEERTSSAVPPELASRPTVDRGGATAVDGYAPKERRPTVDKGKAVATDSLIPRRDVPAGQAQIQRRPRVSFKEDVQVLSEASADTMDAAVSPRERRVSFSEQVE
eukprot:9293910-Pyramimonas_sp.AAC.1